MLCAAAGLEVRSLARVRVGGLRLPPDLAPGAFRRLAPADVARVTSREAQEWETRRSREDDADEEL